MYDERNILPFKIHWANWIWIDNHFYLWQKGPETIYLIKFHLLCWSSSNFVKKGTENENVLLYPFFLLLFPFSFPHWLCSVLRLTYIYTKRSCCWVNLRQLSLCFNTTILSYMIVIFQYFNRRVQGWEEESVCVFFCSFRSLWLIIVNDISIFLHITVTVCESLFPSVHNPFMIRQKQHW